MPLINPATDLALLGPESPDTQRFESLVLREYVEGANGLVPVLVPDPFLVGDWSVGASSTVFRFDITIINLPANTASIEYRAGSVNEPWEVLTASPSETGFTIPINVPAGVAIKTWIRPLNSQGTFIGISDLKTVGDSVVNSGGSNAAPTTINVSNLTVADDLSSGGTIGVVSFDGTPTPTLSIDSDPDNKFTLSGNTLITDAALDYDVATSHSVGLSVTNSEDTYREDFTVNVTDAGAVQTDAQAQADILIAEHETPNSMYEGVNTYTGTQDVSGFPTTNANNWAAVEAAFNAHNWANDLVIYLNWNGDSPSGTQLRGPGNGALTANSTIYGGYERPAGEIVITPKAGKNPTPGGIDKISGVPRVHFKDIDFGTSGGGYDGRQQVGHTLPNAVVFTGCKIVGTTRCNNAAVAHWENCSMHVSGYNQILLNGPAMFMRLHDIDILTGAVDDVFAMRLEVSSVTQMTNTFCHIWFKSLFMAGIIDNPTKSNWHGDFIQTGGGGTAHKGYHFLMQEVFSYMGDVDEGNSNYTQGTLMSDQALGGVNTMVFQNVELHSCTLWGICMYDNSGEGNIFIDFCTLGPTEGQRFGPNDDVENPQYRIGSKKPFDAYLAGEQGGTVVVSNSIGSFSNGSTSGAVVTTSNLASFSGSTGATVGTNGTEDYHTGPFDSRTSGQRLHFSITNQYHADFATRFWAAMDFWKPIAGYRSNGRGISDPATWSVAPARP